MMIYHASQEGPRIDTHYVGKLLFAATSSVRILGRDRMYVPVYVPATQLVRGDLIHYLGKYMRVRSTMRNGTGNHGTMEIVYSAETSFSAATFGDIIGDTCTQFTDTIAEFTE